VHPQVKRELQIQVVVVVLGLHAMLSDQWGLGLTELHNELQEVTGEAALSLFATQ
jgi:hypothetical protein